MKYSKLILAGSALLLLNGCLEVEENDNSTDVAQAINAQTQAIAEQQISESSVTFQGLVVDVFDHQPVATALVKVVVGSDVFAEDIVATDGEFEVTKLPANSDIEVVISSADNQFLTRAFFLNTGDSSASAAIKDFGMFSVSQPQEVQITVLNSEDNSAISTLEFNAYSHVGNSSSILKYKHSSTYDSVNGQYTITLPKHINTSVRANIDFDRDGNLDFVPESYHNVSGSDLYIGSANSIETLTVYVDEVTDLELTDIEYRVSILDGASASIAAAKLTVEDENNQVVNSVYDATTEQHVISAKFAEQITLNMPAFSDNGVYYQSATIYLYGQDVSNTQVNISGSQSNCCFSVPNSDVIALALLPRVTSNSSTLEVVSKSQTIDIDNSTFTVFYSQGISVPTESTSIKSVTGFTTTKGNDSADDLILPGTTLFTGGFAVPSSHTLTLNNTKLAITPASPLTQSGLYKFNVGNVEVNTTNQMVDINDDSLFFDHVNTNQIFDINGVKLDNENYTTNGVVIASVNTANEVSSSYDRNRSVYFYLPTSIQNLQNFTMRQVSVTEDNIARTDVQNFTFVDDGNIYSHRVGVVKLAENEVVVNDDMSINVITGAAQDDTNLVYRKSNYEYMSDNTSTLKNSISFEYAYETLAGDISTGTITIPVQ